MSFVAHAAASQRMSRQRTRDTGCELAIRRKLHALGHRFRVDFKLKGLRRSRGDLVFTRLRLVVFVDGCFWHVCPVHQTWPRSNVEWWRTKLERNVARDRETDKILATAGWTVVRIWEHENPTDAAKRVVLKLRQLRTIQS